MVRRYDRPVGNGKYYRSTVTGTLIGRLENNMSSNYLNYTDSSCSVRPRIWDLVVSWETSLSADFENDELDIRHQAFAFETNLTDINPN